MKLCLDGMFFRCSGVGRVYENLLGMLLGCGDVNKIYTVIPRFRRDEFDRQYRDARLEPLFVPYGPMSPGDLLLKGVVLRRLAGAVSLFVFPGHDVPFSMPRPYAVSVNDLTVFSPHFEAARHRKAGFRWLLGRAVRGAAAVVTISEAVKGDLVRTFRLPPGKVRVIHPWIKEIFFRPREGPPAGTPAGEGGYLLYVGLRIPHKNLDGLVRAFLLLAEDFPGLRLVVAGMRYREPDMVDRWMSDPRLKGRVVEVLDPPDEAIAGLYAGARAFVFPSFAEGFGLPPLEAMASGVPVVCSDIPVFREVYGDAPCYVDPHRPESIAEGIRRVLSDGAFAAELARRGRERAGLYRRERTIEAYLDLFREWGRASPGPSPAGKG